MLLDILKKYATYEEAATISYIQRSIKGGSHQFLERGNHFEINRVFYEAVICYQLAIENYNRSQHTPSIPAEAQKRLDNIRTYNSKLDGDTCLKIANLFLMAEMPRAASRWYERAVEKGKIEEGYAGIGDCYQKQGLNDVALGYYITAYNGHIRYSAKLMLMISAPGITIDEIILIGNTLFNKQDYQNALSVFKSLLIRNTPDIYYYVAISKHKSAQKIHELEQEILKGNQNASDEIEKIYDDALWPSERITIGDMYLLGEHVPQSNKRAERWYRSAQEMNYMVADERLGKLYEKTYGANSNPKFAYEKYYKLAFRALDKNLSCDDTFMAAIMCEEGQWIVRDIHRAIRFYNDAANMDSQSALIKLMNLYQFGYEPDERETKRKIFISNRYNKNEIVFSTENRLEPNILLYTFSCLKIENDKERKEKINELLNMGENELISPSDLCNIAFMLYTEKLLPEALSLYQLAEKKGSALAIGNLGLFYLNKDKTNTNNRRMALVHFQNAVNKGEVRFQELIDNLPPIPGSQITPAVAPATLRHLVLSSNDIIDPNTIINISERLTLLENMAKEKGITLKELGKFFINHIVLNRTGITVSYAPSHYEPFLNTLLSYYLAMTISDSGEEKLNIYELITAKRNYNLEYISHDDCIDIGLIFYSLGYYNEGILWLENASKCYGNTGRAHYFLGHLYEKGVNIPQNMTLALKHYELSSEEGYQLSVAHVDRLKKEIKPSEPAAVNPAAAPS